MLGRYIQSVFGAVLPRYDSVAILKHITFSTYLFNVVRSPHGVICFRIA
jgi:hypothetical protein